jgi:hypothetical protein
MCEPQFANAKERYDYVKQQVDAAAAAQLAHDQEQLQIAFVRWQDRDCTPHGSRHAEYVDDGKFAITAAADDPILPSLTQLGRDAKARGYHVEEDNTGGTVTVVVYCPHTLAANRAQPITWWPSFLTATALWTDRFGMNPRRCVRGHEEPHNRTHQAAVAVYRAVRTILAADVCSQVACREAGPVHPVRLRKRDAARGDLVCGPERQNDNAVRRCSWLFGTANHSDTRLSQLHGPGQERS